MIGLLGLDFFGVVLGVVTHLPAVKGMFYNYTDCQNCVTQIETRVKAFMNTAYFHTFVFI